MTFFQSDVVRAEIAEIQELQEEVYGALFKFPTMPKEDKQYHVDCLERLIEKQKVLYTRLSLSDDPEAKKMKETIMKGAKDMGLPTNVDMNLVFNDIHKMVDVMKKAIDEDNFKMQNMQGTHKPNLKKSEVIQCLLKTLKNNLLLVH